MFCILVCEIVRTYYDYAPRDANINNYKNKIKQLENRINEAVKNIDDKNKAISDANKKYNDASNQAGDPMPLCPQGSYIDISLQEVKYPRNTISLKDSFKIMAGSINISDMPDIPQFNGLYIAHTNPVISYSPLRKAKLHSFAFNAIPSLNCTAKKFKIAFYDTTKNAKVHEEILTREHPTRVDTITVPRPYDFNKIEISEFKTFGKSDNLCFPEFAVCAA